MREWVRRSQINNDGDVTELKLLKGERRMTSAVDTGIATITIFMFFVRGTRILVGYGIFRRRSMIACRCHVALHGMSTFVHAIDRDGQHDC